MKKDFQNYFWKAINNLKGKQIKDVNALRPSMDCAETFRLETVEGDVLEFASHSDGLDNWIDVTVIEVAG